MNVATKSMLSLTVALSLNTIAWGQDARTRGDTPTVDLTASIVRIHHPEKHAHSADPFKLTSAQELAVQSLIDPLANDWRAAAVLLASDGYGRRVLEEIIMEFRVTDNARWTETFAAYARFAASHEVPERMIPEYVADLQLQQTCEGTIAALNRLAEFGIRAKGALGAVQWIRDLSLDPEQVEAAGEAVRRINGGRKLRLFTGC